MTRSSETGSRLSHWLLSLLWSASPTPTGSSEQVVLHMTAHTHLRRGKRRLEDKELHTTRLVGAGWTWDCSCGERGTWHAEREDAHIAAKTHQFFAHGGRDSSPTRGTEES